MSLHWYNLPKASSRDLATYLEHLRPLGVRWVEKPGIQPTYTYDPDADVVMKEVGSLVVHTKTGVIRATAFGGLLEVERFAIARSAERAFTVKPSAREHWHHVRRDGGYWRTNVLVPVSEAQDMVGSLVARAARSLKVQNYLAVEKFITETLEAS